MKMMALCVAIILFSGYANAQECADLIQTALKAHDAVTQLVEESDDLKDTAMARLQMGANYQRPIQQSFTKLLEAQKKMREVVSTLDKAVAKQCGPTAAEVRDDQKDALDVLTHGITSMRKAAAELKIKLSG
jgi:flavodoxin